MASLFNVRPHPDKTIITKTASSASSSFSPTSPPCTICTTTTPKPATYRCRTCNILYCSSACFQSHNSGSCFEAFAKAQIRKTTDLEQAADDKKGISGVLQRELAASREESPPTPSSEQQYDELLHLAQAMSTSNTGDVDALLDSMSESLRAKFLEDVNNTEQQVEQWNPWWLPQLGAGVDAGDDAGDDAGIDTDDSTTPFSIDIDSVMLSLPPFLSLLPSSSTTSPPFLFNNLKDIIFSYVVITRVYNNDFVGIEDIVLSTLLSNSLVLSKDKRYNEFDEVLETRHNTLESLSWCDHTLESFIIDVTTILSNKRYTMISLRLLSAFLESCVSMKFKMKHSIKGVSTVLIKKMVKKVLFYMCYVNSSCYVHDQRLIA
jgi:hypothetical protein